MHTNLAIALLLTAASLPAQQQVPEIPIDASVDFLKLPSGANLGEVAGVAIDARRHLYVFSRTGSRSTVHGATASQLFEFGPDGAFIREIASDNAGNIYVADRSNRRIQVFDHDGTFVRQFTIDVPYNKEPNVMVGALPVAGADPLAVSGAPWAICITPGPNQVLFSADAVPGRIYKLSLDGKVLG